MFNWTKASRKAREAIREKYSITNLDIDEPHEVTTRRIIASGKENLDVYQPLSLKDLVIKEETDMVEKPKHYMVIPEKDVEVRHIMIALLQKMEQSEYSFSGIEMSDYVQMMQYLLRCMDKENYFQDLRKAKWYLNKLLEKE